MTLMTLPHQWKDALRALGPDVVQAQLRGSLQAHDQCFQASLPLA